MMKPWLLVALVAACAAKDRFLHGLKPDVRAQVSAASTLSCDSSTKTIPIASVNDDYCDCRDGTDEPGTAACSHTNVKFHCENKGYFAKDIPTSRVNDGLCDCCDGSDEYHSNAAPCPQTCADLRAEHDKKAQVEELGRAAGRNARAKIVAESKLKKEEHFRKRTDLEIEKAALDKAVDEARALKVHEEALEVAAQKDAARATRTKVATHLGLVDMSSEQLIELILDLADKIYTKSDVLDAVRGVQTHDKSVLEQQEQAYVLTEAAHDKEVERIKSLNADLKQAKDAAQAAIDAAKKAKEDAGESVDDVDVLDTAKYEPEALPTKPERPIVQLFRELQADQSITRPEASAARDALSSAENKVRQIDLDLDTVTKNLESSVGYGPDDVLYSLRDTCVEATSGQYTYKMCFFGQALQDHTSLGTMQPIETPLTTIKFTGGAKCWNGPERSFGVQLVCAEAVALSGIEEPSTCVYTATLETPIACVDAVAAAGTTHDEL
ncbi:Aste57867_9281 [Aphanomyces stellatus]|uniref:Glucosidase 2 subunit beta n=1 Tax=Aphanomyces stellatus TaxID=120398 RepID=A0A485KME5_9STRA|nr:hypothetical protein As57867_009245 [Aphanomyces stellatus]VFT86163.1 Aste57867_9281 [Aphanomyces stellatus]